MEVVKFGLGIRFDVAYGEYEQATPEQLWEEIFSVLTTSETKGMMVYGGFASYVLDDSCYTCVLMNGSLKKMRRVYNKLKEDAGVCMYLTATHPFLQNNALAKINGLTYFGKVQSDGAVAGGENLCVSVCKKRGKNRPVGKGIVLLLAPEAYGEHFPSKQAIRRLTIAARNIFTGVRILPLPIARGGPDTVDALLLARSGIKRTIQVKGPKGEPITACYAAFGGKTALIETPAPYQEKQRGYCSSFGIGEIVRRALDEGLTEIVIGIEKCCVNDYGTGFLRALGAKMQDNKEEEIDLSEDELERLHAIDTEYLHKRLAKTSFIIMQDKEEVLNKNTLSFAQSNYFKLLKQIRKNDAEPETGNIKGIENVINIVCKSETKTGLQALFYVAEIEKRIRNVSLVVTGGLKAEVKNGVSGQLLDICQKHKVPVVFLFGSVEKENEAYFALNNCSIIQTGEDIFKNGDWDEAQRKFDMVAGRMFKLIKMGGEIERFSTRKGEYA